VEKDTQMNLRALALCFEKTCYYIAWEEERQERLFHLLMHFFASEAVHKIGFDVKDFYAWLFRFKGTLKSLVFDGYLGAYLLDPSDNRYGFHEVVEKYL